MRQTLGQITVVGEKKKAFRLGIQPADVEEARQMRRKQVENGVARIWVTSRRNKTSRLMQHDIEPALAVDEFAVDFDVVAVSRLRAEIGADLAVDRYASGCDQFIAIPPRAEAGCAKKTDAFANVAHRATATEDVRGKARGCSARLPRKLRAR